MPSMTGVVVRTNSPFAARQGAESVFVPMIIT
jgi:hypothetical protein